MWMSRFNLGFYQVNTLKLKILHVHYPICIGSVKLGSKEMEKLTSLLFEIILQHGPKETMDISCHVQIQKLWRIYAMDLMDKCEK